MATLTWQDVAGYVRSPDTSDASRLITQGIEQLGTGVRALGEAPEQRRQADLAKQLLIASTARQGAMEQAQMSAELGKVLKAERKEKDAEEFNAVRSMLEAGVRKTVANGGTIEDYLQNSPEWAGLDEGARSLVGSVLADAAFQGETQRERQEDNARQERYFQMNYALALQNAAETRRARAEAAAERNAGKPKVWNTGNDKTDRAMTLLGEETGRQFLEASGAAYANVDLPTLGKNYENLGAVSDIFNDVNRERRKQGKPLLPDNVLKRVVATSVGSRSFINGINDVDDSAIRNALLVAGEQYDTALKGKMYYERLGAQVDAGARPTQLDVDRDLNDLFRPKDQRTPAPPSASPAPAQAAGAAPLSPEVLRLLELRDAGQAKKQKREQEDRERGLAMQELLRNTMANTPPAPVSKGPAIMTPEELMAFRDRNLGR